MNVISYKLIKFALEKIKLLSIVRIIGRGN